MIEGQTVEAFVPEHRWSCSEAIEQTLYVSEFLASTLFSLRDLFTG
ncbi:hypothetical protein ACPOL_2751 [Acidisarcina polymorpha]|uniref:Uncharacterized protein n=1 Tax=Acidisarcina polymorpha TaxID=2211140 RepID=A0A2Z5FZ37_9BACT|nr:hypothetical protein ACPOL_2751 [Acidisarcina polymorpha]